MQQTDQSSRENVRLNPSWKKHLIDEFSQPYMTKLKEYLVQEYIAGKVIYPSKDLYFAALNRTPFDSVKIVLLGQDPYHRPGQAHGLCFSVPPGVAPPPSLVNVFKELRTDIGIKQPNHGCLDFWAAQGVLLLNSTLTVEEGLAGSHQRRGWEEFTDKIIINLNEHRKDLVFMLWGSYAQKKGQAIDRAKHLVLEAPHPSPLSAHRGFLGCKHFSRANQHLELRGVAPIDWQLPSIEQAFRH
jgi:uracil-DNA glycosylase